MANDPYESRRGWRDPRSSRPQGDDRFERGSFERGSFDRDREDRGFFERAGDEIASWFGDEEAERRRMYDDPERGRRFERADQRSDYGSRQRFGGGPGRFGRSDYDRDRDYRPITGDYGRSDYEPIRPPRGEFGGREFGGRGE